MLMILYLALGTGIGLVMALTGAGGGIMAVPLLVFVLHAGIAEVVPIALLAVMIAAGTGALLGLRAGIVRYRAALLMAAAGMLLSPVGVWIAPQIDNRWLTLAFAMLLGSVGLAGIRGTTGKTATTHGAPCEDEFPCMQNATPGRLTWTSRCAASLAFAGGLAGLFSGLLGVGGGFVIVPALQRFTNLAMSSIVATSLAVMALIASAGIAAAGLYGHMNWGVALPFAGGTLTGMLAGRRLARRLESRHMQRMFSLLAIGVAVSLLLSAWH